MGVLADIYSGGNTLKRKLNALLVDPVGEINTGVTRAREDYNKLTNLFANAYPMAGDRTVLNSPAQIAQFQREAADTGANMGMAAATVWHGSPHKFDKFDASKIGTGEGAQAYGHGLYLAENPDVAKSYQLALTHSDDYVDGQLLDSSIPKHFLARILSDESGNVQNARQSLQLLAMPGGSKSVSDSAKQALKMLDAGERPALKTIKPDGSLYKVDLPDEHIAKMLDYDNAVPETVRKPLSQAALKEFGSGLTDTSGEKLYKEMIFNFKQTGHPNPTQAATDWLTKQGVPGMRYLDGGSRGTGQGTSNFVVFPGNEGLLNILERNGQPMNQLQKLLK